MDKIRNILFLVKSQLWIVPVGMTALAMVLAWLMLGPLNRIITPEDTWWLYSGDIETARGLLSTTLSGMITMTALVVSITFVVLTLAANQLGPRLIWQFIGDRQIQAVIGLFLSTIVYSLIVLRTLSNGLDQEATPHLAVTLASILTITSLLSLLLYVHKVAHAVVADTALYRVEQGLQGLLGDLLSDTPNRATATSPPPPIDAHVVSLEHCGYVQTIDYGALVKIAKEEDLVIWAQVRAGHFVLPRGAHVIIAGKTPEGECIGQIRDAFVVGSERSAAQDIEYSFRQLVEIALRALSPSMNDPFTAIAAIDRIASALATVLSRNLPDTSLYDEHARLRVVARRSSFAGVISQTLDHIRQATGDNPAVLIRLADTVGKLAPSVRRSSEQQVFYQFIRRLQDTANIAVKNATDRAAVIERSEQAEAELKRNAQNIASQAQTGLSDDRHV